MELIIALVFSSQKELLNAYKSIVRIAPLIPDIIREHDSPLEVAKAVPYSPIISNPTDKLYPAREGSVGCSFKRCLQHEGENAALETI